VWCIVAGQKKGRRIVYPFNKMGEGEFFVRTWGLVLCFPPVFSWKKEYRKGEKMQPSPPFARCPPQEKRGGRKKAGGKGGRRRYDTLKEYCHIKD